MKLSEDRFKALVEQRVRLTEKLREYGIPMPRKQPFDDEVTFNNTLLELVEEAEAEVRHG